MGLRQMMKSQKSKEGGVETGLKGLGNWYYMFPPSLTLARYAYLLLMLVSSLGKTLRSTVPSLHHPTHRPYTTFPQEPVMAKVFEGMTKCLLPS